MIADPSFEQALRHLREQGIAVECGPVEEDGIVCQLLGHTLTDLQVIKLFEYGRLTPEGIAAFSGSIKIESYRKKAFPLPSDSNYD